MFGSSSPLQVVPPLPIDADARESTRWEHTRLRRRLLYGEWEDDLVTRISQQVGTVRRQAWGRPDLSANPFRSLCAQLAVLYDRAPVISHPDDLDGKAAEALTAALQRAGAWSLMARVQRDTIGLREMLVRVDICEDDGRLLLRPVAPSLVIADPDPQDPSRCSRLREARLRREPETKLIGWTWDVVTPSAGTYAITRSDGTTDVTSTYEPAGLSGDRYPARLAGTVDELTGELLPGRPVLPYAWYHASQTGCLWDAWEGFELVEGTLQVGVYWTFWGHILKMASWPQRYAAGFVPAGSTQEGDAEGNRAEVVTDPATLLLLQRLADDSGQGLIGQFQPGGDPAVVGDAIIVYEKRVIGNAGLAPPDFVRQSGDPRSGYALSISKEGQREAARRMEPQQRRGDEQLLTLCAAALNRWSERQGAPLGLPELGWRIRYEAIPLSPDEQAALREQVMGDYSAGLIDKPDAYIALNPGTTRPEAIRRLAEIAAANRPMDRLLPPTPQRRLRVGLEDDESNTSDEGGTDGNE